MGGTPLYLKGLLRGIFRRAAGRLGVPQSASKEGGRTRGYSTAGWPRSTRSPREAPPERHPAADSRPGGLREDRRADQPAAAAVRTAGAAEQCRVFVLDWPREELYRRIDRRVDRMFAAGLVEEVRGAARQAAAARQDRRPGRRLP